MRCRITASRRATAMISRFIPRCRAIFMPQAFSHDHLRLQTIRAKAASNNITRIMRSPHFETAPIRSVSPDWYRRGVKPNAAPTVFELLKRDGTSTVARKVSATTGPTPGAVISCGRLGRDERVQAIADAERQAALV